MGGVWPWVRSSFSPSSLLYSFIEDTILFQSAYINLHALIDLRLDIKTSGDTLRDDTRL
jgi:hypothetical protein